MQSILSCKSIDSQQAQGLPQGQSCKALAAYLSWQIQCLLSILLALRDKGYIFSLRSWDSSILSYQGAVTSTSTTCLVPADHRTMPGLRLVCAIIPGNLRHLYGSACFFQSNAIARTSLHFASTAALSLALTKWMKQDSRPSLPAVPGFCHGATDICHQPGYKVMTRGHAQGWPVSHGVYSLNSLTTPMCGGLMAWTRHHKQSTTGTSFHTLPCLSFALRYSHCTKPRRSLWSAFF